ncbi:27373_t:CDS:2 [Gigaspora margarita]|uniref:27373_t:CDS:1 n=1 Tax=Gigaspora margarita TaxID=4874 RepID=A0ABN7UKP5_GIGMA|nr:27373_t:CDS:2 [Gigaspora margarita]
MVNPISSTLMTITVLSTCSFCYIQTIREIRSIKKQQATITTSQNITIFPVTDVELRVSVKVLGYILVFIVQWPIGNLIFFIINEGWSRNQTNLSSGYADVKCESGDSSYNSSSTNGNKSHESDFN